jgi:hypothetical protein
LKPTLKTNSATQIGRPVIANRIENGRRHIRRIEQLVGNQRPLLRVQPYHRRPPRSDRMRRARGRAFGIGRFRTPLKTGFEKTQ